mmetsp:Transcript_21170/g.49015  ORF Transcript_21170/g.49015 Transcript_21170/m.49015 type:complete len:236 (-) Transcript_21170:848-1555(-)
MIPPALSSNDHMPPNLENGDSMSIGPRKLCPLVQTEVSTAATSPSSPPPILASATFFRGLCLSRVCQFGLRSSLVLLLILNLPSPLTETSFLAPSLAIETDSRIALSWMPLYSSVSRFTRLKGPVSLLSAGFSLLGISNPSLSPFISTRGRLGAGLCFVLKGRFMLSCACDFHSPKYSLLTCVSLRFQTPSSSLSAPSTWVKYIFSAPVRGTGSRTNPFLARADTMAAASLSLSD